MVSENAITNKMKTILSKNGKVCVYYTPDVSIPERSILIESIKIGVDKEDYL